MRAAIAPGVALAGGAALTVVLALVIGSIAALIWAAGLSLSPGPAGWAAVRFTLLQATLSAGLSVALAVPFARALARRRFRGRQALVCLLGAPFLLPAIVAVLGLLAVWGRSGVMSELSQMAGGPRLSIYGLTGVVLAHVFFNLPLVTRLILQGWQDIPGERFRLAAQLGFRGRDVFRWLEWPMLRSVLPGAFVLVFLLCMTSFAVALALGGGPRATTIEVAIYQALRFEFALDRAAGLALVQVGLCAAVALLALGISRPAGFGAGLGAARVPSAGGAALDFAVIGLGAAFLLAPLVMVTLRGVLGLSGGMPPGLWPALWTSLRIAAVSAALAVGLALALAALVTALPRGRGIAVEAMGLLMLAASPFVIGTGMFIALRELGNPLDWALVVTAVINAAMSLPFALRALVPPQARIRADQGRLMESLGMGGWARFRLVVLPGIRAPLGFAGGLAAALSMGDLGVITLFAPPGVETLPLYMYRLMGAYQITAASGAALVLLVASLGVFWICDRGGRLGHHV